MQCCMYDEENIDLEEQMYQNDILNDDIDSDIIDEDSEDDEYNTDKYVLSRFFLDTQLNLPDKKKQVIRVIHKKTNKIFEGIVIGRDQNNHDKYLFDMYSVIDDELSSEKKYKIFNINDIKKV